MKLVPLGEVASIDRTSVKPNEIDESTPYVGLEHITSDGKIIRSETIESADVRSNKFVFTTKHVLFGRLRPYLAKITRPAFAGACSTDILPLKPGPKLDRGYLTHFLRHPQTVSLATARATGANLPRINPRVLTSFRVPLPPITEQRRIATILDKADSLRTKYQEKLARLDELPQAIFHEMFGASVADISVEDAAIKMRTGPFGSQLLHSEFVDEGISVLGLDNVVSNRFKWGELRFITEKKYRQLERYTVRPGDILISIMGTTGRCVIVPDDIPTAINTKHICAISPDLDRYHPEFLRGAFLWHPTARKFLLQRTKGSIMAGLNMGIIKKMPIPTPPLELQHSFTERIKAIDAQRELIGKATQQIDELFASLQSRAFSGKL